MLAAAVAAGDNRNIWAERKGWWVMRRASRGAGWRRIARAPGAGGSDAVGIVVVDSWLPARGGDAIDEKLRARVGRALFDDEGRLRRSIRIPTRGEVEWVAGLKDLVDVLGAGPRLLLGWWRGDAGYVEAALGDPDCEVPLERGTDLDLVVWGASRGDLLYTLHAAREMPTMIATSGPGWVLISPPSSDEMFLYPEVSAWGE
nr:hypothetical protein [Propionicimonas sp.]